MSYSCTAAQSKIFSPVEKMFQTTVPTKYSPTETLNTSSHDPASKITFLINHERRKNFLKGDVKELWVTMLQDIARCCSPKYTS